MRDIHSLLEEAFHFFFAVSQTERNGVLPDVRGIAHPLAEVEGDALPEGALALDDGS